MRSVLFVCLGNICRSPLAEGVFRHQLAQRSGLEIEFDSAGTAAYHQGEPPDERMRDVAQRHGVSLEGQRARRVVDEDFDRFDLILAMDAENLRNLRRRAPGGNRERIRLFREFDPKGTGDVPDPYYGGPDGFEEVFDIADRSCAKLLDHLQASDDA